MNKKNRFPMNAGISWILVIFILLCLVTFGVLSMVSAHSDHQMSEKTASHTQDYYSAANAAQEVLEQVDKALEDAMSCDLYPGQALDMLAQNSSLAKNHSLTVERGALATDTKGAQADAGTPSSLPSISFTEPVSDTLALEVSLEVLTSPEAGENYYRITKWQTVSTAEPSYENSDKLFNGTLE